MSKSSGLTTDTNEMLIQTPKSGSHHSILNSKALLEHLGVLEKALSVTVDLFDVYVFICRKTLLLPRLNDFLTKWLI